MGGGWLVKSAQQCCVEGRSRSFYNWHPGISVGVVLCETEGLKGSSHVLIHSRLLVKEKRGLGGVGNKSPLTWRVK